MKPNKPPFSPSTRDRDILRARNSRPLKATGQTNPSSSTANPASLSTTSSEGQPSVKPGALGTEQTDSDSALDKRPDLAESSVLSPSPSSSSNSDKDKNTEMKVYLDKLRELVPYVPRTGKISKVELIHSAIDYITDLQESLEARARKKLRDKNEQSNRPPLAALSQAHVETNNLITPLMENNSNRPPTLLETNTRHPSTLAALAALSPEEGSDNLSDLSLSSNRNFLSVSESGSSPLIPEIPEATPPSAVDST